MSGDDNRNRNTMPSLVRSAHEFTNINFDYLIIGGGTAGLVIAARLSEDHTVTVGVLEAGQNRLSDPVVDTPAMFPLTLRNDDYDWAFTTEPQVHNRGVKHHVPRGRLLGGSSGINYMMYVRGSLQDYDDWATISGDPSWGSKSMKEYMKKHQTFEPHNENLSQSTTTPLIRDNHGTSGPIHTTFNESLLPIERDFEDACNEVTGFCKKPSDPWSGDHLGFFNTLGCVSRSGPDKGKRSYAARGYFERNSGRSNLRVLCEARVHSLILDPQNRAIGAEFSWESSTYSVKAAREVIVSCGTIQTPQILELSGIGDPEVLRSAGVDCKVVNMAIGNNLQDHPMTGFGWELASDVSSLEVIYDPDVMKNAQKVLEESKGGPLTNISSTQGFFPYKLFATATEQAKILELVNEGMKTLTPFQKKQYDCIMKHLKDDHSANMQLVLIPHAANFKEGVEDQSKLFPPTKPGQPMGMTAGVCFQYPLSRGTVHIKSSNIMEHPSIDPNILSHPADIAILAAGVKMLDQVTRSQALKGKITKCTYPSDPSRDLSDTTEAQEAVTEWVMSQYHPVGSCAMGDALDSRLRVYGVKRLRVVDASAFPSHVSGNCVASVYALAEKAADMIKEDWGFSTVTKK